MNVALEMSIKYHLLKDPQEESSVTPYPFQHILIFFPYIYLKDKFYSSVPEKHFKENTYHNK